MTDTPTPPSRRFLKLPEVINRTALSETRIFELEQEGQFPRRVRLSTKATGWLEHEIEEWIDARIKISRGGGEFAPRKDATP